jgi:murein DD-endopeptidase MepM/ murein hydrolase activator NlpD
MWTAAVLAFLMMIGANPAFSQTEDRVEDARRNAEAALGYRIDVQARLDDATERYWIVNNALEALIVDVNYLEERIADGNNQRAALRERVQEEAIELYMGGASGGLESVFAAETITDSLIGQEMLATTSATDGLAINDLKVLNRALEAETEILVAKQAELATQQRQADALVVEMNALFQEANEAFQAANADLRDAESDYQAEQRRLAEERAREVQRQQTEAAQRTSTGTSTSPDSSIVCPMAAPISFWNDWGAPRSGGRTHKGNDVFSAYDHPVVAVVDGVTRIRNGGLGGLTVWLNGDNGVSYYYAHLSGWAAGITTGTRVVQGQLIGFNGTSGNAKGTPAHVHFEIHPGGGAAVNPYATLKAACG